MNNKRFVWEVRPNAEKENTVVCGKARFTVLQSRLIRMEYSHKSTFCDKASQSVFYRDFPKCEYKTSTNNGLLAIETSDLILSYKVGEEFARETLSIKLKTEPATTWYYGDEVETLGGTAQTLDGVNDYVQLCDGVCSQFGFAVIDDSDTMLLGEDGWVELREKNTTDLYFFGYGYSYKDAVKDYFKLTGVPPMLPAYALGNWWSRYHKYTQEEYENLMLKFEKQDIPFSVAVIDMDWHLVDIDDEQAKKDDIQHGGGWTGYTWNKELFPDYRAFLKFLHKHNLRTSLNLHPAMGVYKFETQYEEMAKAMGVDPKSGQRIPFDILSKEYMANYFDVLHHPYEEDGVDFWWMDWQQGDKYWWIHEENKDGKLHNPLEVLNPLWMLNHLHILDISRKDKRPMFFSRFSGPGSQRYPLGFSGDTFVTWDALRLQPYFTATASNIGYCWWSHDIGGHMRGDYDEELMTRWIQLGAFSPINRLHSSNDDFLSKDPEAFNIEYKQVIEKALRFRHELFPYLYSMNYRCHHELEPMVQPMYYSHPKNSDAYKCDTQFWFGSELMVSAVVSPRNPESKLSQVNVWFPKGHWFDMESGVHYYSETNRNLRVFRSIEEYPAFARAGAIIPMAVREKSSNKLENAKEMNILVFPGESNQFRLYEDAGDGYGYKQGESVTTEFELKWHNDTAAGFVINKPEGNTALIPESRIYHIVFRGFNKNITVFDTQSGKDLSNSVVYDKEHNSTIITVSSDLQSDIQISLKAENLINDNSDVLERCKKILLRCHLTGAEKGRLMKIVSEEDTDIMSKMWKMYIGCVYDYSTDIALRELLTLTDNNYR